MSYIEGYVIPVPTDRKGEYERVARSAAPVFHEYGASRVVECWGDDVPAGEVTDFRRAVQAHEGESIVFSWVEWPSREVRAQAAEKMKNDPRMQMTPDMPFDGKRVILGGFEVLIDTNEGEAARYAAAPAQEGEPARH